MHPPVVNRLDSGSNTRPIADLGFGAHDLQQGIDHRL